MVNKVILLGNLGKDPEVKTLENGNKMAKFPLATSEKYTDKNTGQLVENTEWHNVVLWRGLADLAEKYLRKGNQVYVDGKIRTGSWEDNGEKRYSTEIVANDIRFVGNRPQEQNTAPASQQKRPEELPTVDFKEVDELPF